MRVAYAVLAGDSATRLDDCGKSGGGAHTNPGSHGNSSGCQNPDGTK